MIDDPLGTLHFTALWVVNLHKIFANQVVLIMCGQILKSIKFFSENRNFGPFWVKFRYFRRVKMTFIGGEIINFFKKEILRK